MEIRLALENDLKNIIKIINQAKVYMKNNNFNQWNDNYPNNETISKDIKLQESYVLIDDEKIVGTFVLSFDGEINYKNIYEGNWKTNNPYGVLHRVAIDDLYKGKGLAKLILDFSEKEALKKGIKNFRIDTHKENKSMRKFIEKNGFEYCGIILVEDETERVAYEKIL
ncbi:MAG: GNAT family N-acetyltransferase [Fusobacterium perfoetens]|uniref:GNAT family N-acetyltransferase n=1 Tax=Fusobacterium perfoetens TaxID=852 RepID=UPI0023F25FB3|nr:GNAT family N-acetyltransferase [Fusobacterium perfoetens]MCI6152365.1 GNAT family N-acetyltransferase [Fusobacterium perfoetens]MDY3236964.1 GNAT family N-acetyltransferase [Fusobacterium perfoetens]